MKYHQLYIIKFAMEESDYIPSDSDDLFIPPVEVDMVVDEENSIVLNDDIVTESPKEESKSYGEELISSGLTSADLLYFNRAYKILDHVKYIRLHCTSCDKHIGSAPNQLQNRYEHPLLKVLVCCKCFHFYSSGDFEKDEDGSELYCRWCGEGGQVFCCTKCPFVFCKKCITRNLGRGTATSIQNSDNWLCFACNPDQISRHRATYWAIQKYSGEIIRKAQETGDTSDIKYDGNICCSQVRKRSDLFEKLKTVTPPIKRRKVESAKQLRLKHTEMGLNKTNTSATWSTEMIRKEPEAEVICTPDIIPIDDSPPGSPIKKPAPPPLVPCSKPITPKANSQQIPGTSVSVNNLHSQLKVAFTKQLYLAPSLKLPPQTIQKSYAAYSQLGQKTQNTIPINDNKYKIILRHASPATPTQKFNVSLPSTPSNNQSNNASVGSPLIPRKDDWFDQAVIHCQEVTEYISTKISSLSDVHTRAYKSSKLMEELHNTLQTYLYVAIEKMHKVKKTMQNNYENECKLNGNTNEIQIMNKLAPINRNAQAPKSVNIKFTPGKTKKRRRKLKQEVVRSSSEDEIFDMDVVNESDESGNTNTDDNYSDIDVSAFMEVQINQPSETINLIDTDDENENNNCESDAPKKSDLVKSEQIPSMVNDGKKSPLVVVKNAKEVLEMLMKNDANYSKNQKEENHTENKSDNVVKTDTTDHNNQSEDETNKDDTQVKSEKGTVQQIDEDFDIETVISSNVVLRQDQANSFRDEFSKFISRTDDIVSDNEDKELENTISIAREIDVAEDILNITETDNGALSLPPETITEFLEPEHLNLLRENVKPKDLVGEGLENELLALKQMAENCVNTVPDKPSAECKG